MSEEERISSQSGLPDLDALRASLKEELNLGTAAENRTILEILTPIRKHQQALGLNQEQLNLFVQTAQKAGALERQSVESKLAQNPVTQLDTALTNIANREDAREDWKPKLARGAKATRDGVIRIQQTAKADVERFPDDKFKEPEDLYQKWFYPDPERREFGYPLRVDYLVDGADKSLATATLQEIGVLEPSEEIGSLPNKVPNQETDIYRSAGLTNYQRLQTTLSDTTVEVYVRSNGTYDIGLKITGDSAMKMVTSETPPNPFENK